MSGSLASAGFESFLQPPRLLGAQFWLHGRESEEELRGMFDRVVASGLGELTLESRPHWDFLGPQWWTDIKRFIRWSKEAGVSLYLFDEKFFVSGTAGDLVQKMDPSYRRSAVRLQYTRYKGPLRQVSIMLPWTHASTSAILGAFAYPSVDGVIRFEEAIDLSDRLRRSDSPGLHGIIHALQWDVPRGDWTVCFLVEDRTVDYIDPLHPGAVEAFIERVYESTRHELGEYFGDPIKGFFFDEPGFANSVNQIPWGYDFRNRFIQMAGYDPLPFVPSLFIGEQCRSRFTFRYHYHTVLSRLFAETFHRPIQQWCRKFGIRYVGHWFEHEAYPDHGERYMYHERTTSGPGDFFEVSRYVDEGGIDLVANQVVPGHRNRDYWGMPKLASSAAHVFGLEDDLALSETFGAYGWHIGLRMMKWLTDWQAVRGINHFVLHAFDAQWPDMDTPPFYYDGGKNPQWPYFPTYAQYANRLSWLLREGTHTASLLLFYPGALGAAGSAVSLEDVQSVLQENQYDYDIVPESELTGQVLISGNQLVLRKERYQGLVVPGLEIMTETLACKLKEISASGIPVLIVAGYPSALVGKDRAECREALDVLLAAPNVHLTETIADLPAAFGKAGVRPQIEFVGEGRADLRILHRTKNGVPFWFVSNENPEVTLTGWVNFPDCVQTGAVVAWEPLSGERWRLSEGAHGECKQYKLTLPPYRSLLLTPESAAEGNGQPEVRETAPAAYLPPELPVELIAIPEEEVSFEWAGTLRRGLPSWLSLDPAFSGTATYTWDCILDLSDRHPGDRWFVSLGKVEEIAELEVNGAAVGHTFVPPYRFDITDTVLSGVNRFRVKVTNVVSNCMAKEEGLENFNPPFWRDPNVDWKKSRAELSIPEDGGLQGPIRVERLKIIEEG